MCESARFHLGTLWPAEILVDSKECWNPHLQAIFKKHAIDSYMANSKIIRIWTYLKANRRIHGTLRTLPKYPPSVDSGNWLIAGCPLH